MARSLEDLGTMLSDLSSASQRVGLKMNKDKMKVMSNIHVVTKPVSVGSATIEAVDSYVYLGQVVQLACNGDPNAEPGCCGQTCSNYNATKELPCNKFCTQNICQCKKGYALDESSGKCVLPKNCPCE